MLFGCHLKWESWVLIIKHLIMTFWHEHVLLIPIFNLRLSVEFTEFNQYTICLFYVWSILAFSDTLFTCQVFAFNQYMRLLHLLLIIVCRLMMMLKIYFFRWCLLLRHSRWFLYFVNSAKESWIVPIKSTMIYGWVIGMHFHFPFGELLHYYYVKLNSHISSAALEIFNFHVKLLKMYEHLKYRHFQFVLLIFPLNFNIFKVMTKGYSCFTALNKMNHLVWICIFILFFIRT